MKIDFKSGFSDISSGFSDIFYSLEEKPPIVIRVINAGHIQDFKNLKKDTKNIRQDIKKAIEKSLNYVQK